MEDFRAEPQLREKAKECLVEYARTFEARNPNLKLIGAYVHMDEASPHLHVDYIPVARGYKTGLQARNSLDKAMKQMGYTPVKESRKTMLQSCGKKMRGHILVNCAEVRD